LAKFYLKHDKNTTSFILNFIQIDYWQTMCIVV
jgi:hypothetical protein